MYVVQDLNICKSIHANSVPIRIEFLNQIILILARLNRGKVIHFLQQEGRYLSECCSQTVYVHPQAVCQQRSDAAGQGEYLQEISLINLRYRHTRQNVREFIFKKSTVNVDKQNTLQQLVETSSSGKNESNKRHW